MKGWSQIGLKKMELQEDNRAGAETQILVLEESTKVSSVQTLTMALKF